MKNGGKSIMLTASVLLAGAAVSAFGLPLVAHASPEAQVDCSLDAGPCEKAAGPFQVILSLAPRPLKVMSELAFFVTVRDRKKPALPVTDASVRVALTMPGMVMGSNVVRLVHTANGVYEGTGVIIRCPTGKKIWKASVIIDRSESKRSADFVFEVRQ